MGASALGAEMITFFAPPFKCRDAFSIVVNTPVDSHTYSAPDAPGDGSGVPLGEELHLGRAIEHQAVAVDLHGSGEHAVHGVVLDLIGGVVDGHERVVHGDNGGVRVLKGGAHHETANAPEAVDSKRDGHGWMMDGRRRVGG